MRNYAQWTVDASGYGQVQVSDFIMTNLGNACVVVEHSHRRQWILFQRWLLWIHQFSVVLTLVLSDDATLSFEGNGQVSFAVPLRTAVRTMVNIASGISVTFSHKES